jgi:hypothetical protein
LRVAVVNVWMAANVICLVRGRQRQRRKDVRAKRMNAVWIDNRVYFGRRRFKIGRTLEVARC